MFESVAKRIRRIFSYLHDEFGMWVAEENVDGVTFRNDTTAVIVSDDARDGVVVAVVRLVEGEIPPYSSAAETDVHWCDLHDLVAVRRPQGGPDLDAALPWKGMRPDHVLQHYATLLRAFGSDVLHGDFSCYVAVGERVVAHLILAGHLNREYAEAQAREHRSASAPPGAGSRPGDEPGADRR